MAEESSLRQAIDKIMGWPAGGEGAGTVKPLPPPGTSNTVTNTTPATSLAIANEVPPPPPDPFADELAALKASNEALSAQIAEGTAAITGETPSTTTEEETGLVAPEETLGYSDYYAGNEAALDMSMYRGDAMDAGVTQDWGQSENPYRYRNDYNQYVLDNDKLWSDYYKATGNTDISYDQYWGGNEEALEREFYHDADNRLDTGENQIWEGVNPYSYSNEYNAYVAGGTPAVSGTAAAAAPALVKPVNPGSRAPWQQSQQYWKDLDAYTKAGGK